jgi:hypothetical protein
MILTANFRCKRRLEKKLVELGRKEIAENYLPKAFLCKCSAGTRL